MTDLLAVPDRLSIEADLPGFRDDAMVVGAWLTIRLDGVQQKYVVAYDRQAGSLVRYCCTESGAFVIEGDEIKRETVFGRVEVERRLPE